MNKIKYQIKKSQKNIKSKIYLEILKFIPKL